jgi:hypothetical protein
VIRTVTAAMPKFVEAKNGIYVISNPVEPKENFADRWRSHPERAAWLFDWAEHAAADFARLGETRGVDSVLQKMASAFGDRPAEHAQRTVASGLFESRRSGRLAMVTGTGTLATAGSRTVRDHSFYGPGHGRP